MSMFPQSMSGQLLEAMSGQMSQGAAGNAPFFSTGMEGTYLGKNPWLSLFLAKPLQDMALHLGISPMGGSGRNALDVIHGQQLWQMNWAIQEKVKQNDISSWMATMKGGAALAGIQWEDAQAGAQKMANFMGSISPTLGMMFPEAMDALAGPRGSAGALASQMMMADRYRYNPVTGRVGVDVNEVSARTDAIMASMGQFGFHGFAAGQVGQMYAGLSARGLMPEMSRQDIEQQFHTRDIDQFISSPQGSMQVRAFQADKVKQNLEHYTGVISAMRDIFGDMGQPDAPIPKLLAAMDVLTNSSASQVPASRLQSMTRMTQQLAETSGYNIDQILTMQQSASVFANHMGLPPIFGVTAAQEGAAFASVMRNRPGVSTPAWGALNPEQMAQMDAQMRISAAASPAAMRMATAIRMDDAVHYAPQSEAGKYIAALRNAERTGNYDFEGESLSIGPERWQQLLTSGHPEVTPAMLATMQSQRDANLGVIDEHGLGNIVRANQWRDYMPTVNGSVRATLIASGVAPERVAAAMQGGLADRIFNMDPTVTHNIGDYDAAIGKELDAAGLGMDETTRRITADAIRGGMDESLQRSPFHVSLTAAQDMTNQNALREQAVRQQENRFSGGLRDAMAPLGQGSLTRRLVGALQRMGSEGVGPAGAKGLLVELLGPNVKVDDVAAQLQKPMAVLMEEEAHNKALTDQYAKAAANKDEAGMTRLRKEIDASNQKISGAVGEIDQSPLLRAAGATATQNINKQASDLRERLVRGARRSDPMHKGEITNDDLQAEMQALDAGTMDKMSAADRQKLTDRYGEDAVAAAAEVHKKSLEDLVVSAGDKAADGKPTEVTISPETTFKVVIQNADGTTSHGTMSPSGSGSTPSMFTAPSGPSSGSVGFTLGSS